MASEPHSPSEQVAQTAALLETAVSLPPAAVERLRYALAAHDEAVLRAQAEREAVAAHALAQTPDGHRAAECEWLAGMVSGVVAMVVPLAVAYMLLDRLGNSPGQFQMLLIVAVCSSIMSFLAVNGMFAHTVKKLRRAAATRLEKEQKAHAD